MVYYDPRKPKPWPIRFLNKCGVTDDTKATNIALMLAVALIIITFFLYGNILGGSSSEDQKRHDIEAATLPTL